MRKLRILRPASRVCRSSLNGSVVLMLFLILSTPQIAFCAIQAAGNSSSSAPQIEKLDPPNWWTGFTPEVMVLASGANLDGATLTCSRPGVKIERSKATAAGKYLFFWLENSACHIW